MQNAMIVVPLVAVFVLVGSLAVAAEPQATPQDPEQKVVITGSHIQQSVRRVGAHSTDGIAPVYIISRQDIERSGGQTVAQVLRRVPFVTVRGF